MLFIDTLIWLIVIIKKLFLGIFEFLCINLFLFFEISISYLGDKNNQIRLRYPKMPKIQIVLKCVYKLFCWLPMLFIFPGVIQKFFVFYGSKIKENTSELRCHSKCSKNSKNNELVQKAKKKCFCMWSVYCYFILKEKINSD